MENTFGKFLKLFYKLLIVAVVLTVIYPGVDFIFKSLLSPLSRAVLSNFILFALIIGLVMKQVVHPKSMLEQAQAVIENEIKDSESAKEASDEELTTIQKSARNVKKEINAILKKSEENARLVGTRILEEAGENSKEGGRKESHQRGKETSKQGDGQRSGSLIGQEPTATRPTSSTTGNQSGTIVRRS